MGLLAGRMDSDLLLLFSQETEVVGSSLEEMESRESRFFFLSLGPSSSSMLSKIERILIVFALDQVLGLTSEDDEDEDEESRDLRLDFFLEDFFLWDFLLDR